MITPRPVRINAVVLPCLSLVMASLLVACGPPAPDPALTAYRQVFAAVGREDAKMFVAGLTPASRDRLRAQLALPATASEAELVKRIELRPGASFEIELPKDAKIVAGAGDDQRRIVEGPLDGTIWRIPVVKVGQAWRVALFDAKKVEAN